MRTTAVEHETEESGSAHRPDAQREQTASAMPEPAQAGPLLFDPALLLGLQSRAGNAAVAALIQEQRKPEAPESFSPAPSEPGTSPITSDGESPAEAAASVPAAGETDDELAVLDAAAEAPPRGSDERAEDSREAVAQDAQAELTDIATPNVESPAATGGAETGVPIDARLPPTPPDVSGAEPAAGLAQVGPLPPALLLSSLGSVSSAVDRQASQEHAQLAADPPQRVRHPGAPATVEGPASSRIPVTNRPAGNVQKVPDPHDVEVARPPAPPVLPEVATANGQLPVRDPGLELKPGPLPHLPMEGSADPARVQQQRGDVLEGMQREHLSGQQEAAQPLGEDQIFPSVQPETLRAVAPKAPSTNGHPVAGPGGEEDEAASIIAQQEKGAEIQGAVSTGLSALTDQRTEYAEHSSAERARADAEMTQLEQANTQEQTAERSAAKGEVTALRGQWSNAQTELVTEGQREADTKTSETVETVTRERQAAEKQAAAHYQEGQREAEQARHQAEQQAAAERQKAAGQGGILGAIGSAAQSLFDKAKQAVQSVFDRARQLVRGAIERAQQLATAVMEKARQTIVGAIRTAGNVLSATSDRVLAAFPALRDRFRTLIQARIAAAEAAVNKLADALKHGVQAILNGLSTALSAAIGLMREGMLAAVEAVRATVRGALDFARGAIAGFGTLAVLVRDIAANPGRWISNLGAAVKDGIQHYLWIEIKTAVQGWFSDKVQEVVGVGEAVWHLLQRGGIAVADIAHMAWEGLKAAIPGILIALLIEKLMSLIVPAVGAILTIIQGLQAAWASLGRILQAFDAFFAFLKHVKLGTAAPLFAKAVAAGAIALVEFVSNFLLTRLKGAASSVSNRLRTIARRIGERFAAVGRRIVKGARAVGSALRRTGQKIRGAFDRLGAKRSRTHEDEQRLKTERQTAAFTATKSRLNALFAKGVSRARLAAEVAWLKVRYRWGTLRMHGSPEARHAVVIGGFSPERQVSEGDLILAHTADDLRSLLKGDDLALTKLDQVQADAHIPQPLKYQFMERVKARMKYWTGQRSRPPLAGYQVMCNVVKRNSSTWTLLGPEISTKTIEEHGGLTRLVNAERVYRSMLRQKYQDEYPTVTAWIKAVSADESLLTLHLRPSAKLSGKNQVAFWSERYHAAGTKIGKYVKQLRLNPADYPLGAVRFVLPPERASVTVFHKPTAFDGMPHKGWTPPEAGGLWGAIRTAHAVDVREAVSRPVAVAETTEIRWIR